MLSEPGILVQSLRLSCRVTHKRPDGRRSSRRCGAAFFAHFLSLQKESESGLGVNLPIRYNSALCIFRPGYRRLWFIPALHGGIARNAAKCILRWLKTRQGRRQGSLLISYHHTPFIGTSRLDHICLTQHTSFRLTREGRDSKRTS